MSDNEIENIASRELNIKNIKIIDMDKVDDYLFIKLENGQNILMNGKVLYNVSGYRHLSSIFNMGDKLCAVMTKGYSLCVVDLKTMKILFEDEKAYDVSKQDDRTLYIMTENGNTTIYDIETKKYLPVPNHYEFENSLGNHLYVFREQHNSEINFFDYKRCVIHADGEILLEDIDGWIELSNNFLIISKKDKLCVVKMNGNLTLDVKTVEQNERVIAKPTYHNGNLIIIEKGAIKTYTPNLTLVNVFFVDGLDEVIDYEIVSDTLKLCLPHTMNGKKINKHLFMNLKTGKSIAHLRIEGYPYWVPTTYIGKDSMDADITDYHFYNANFETIIKVTAHSYESVESNKGCMFVIRTFDGENEHKQLLNAENGSIRDVDYDYIYFHLSLPYGYGVNIATQKIDFFDQNLNIIIPNFDYEKFHLNFYHEEFGYFIMNDYICIHNRFVDNYGKSRWRTIIQKADGEVILDSVQHKCYAMGHFIQIVHNKDSEFFNTITGEMGILGISAELDKTGKIDFEKINSIHNILSIQNTTSAGLLPFEDNQPSKVKKWLPNQKNR